MHTEPSAEEFADFLIQLEAATYQVLNGNATRWKQLCAHADDATIFGGWGGVEQGWARLDAKYSWAAARFVAGELQIEYLATNRSGNLAYTVALERSQVRLIDQTTSAPMVLRVTHLYRYEDEGWKLLHQHADPLMAIAPPATVLQQAAQPEVSPH